MTQISSPAVHEAPRAEGSGAALFAGKSAKARGKGLAGLFAAILDTTRAQAAKKAETPSRAGSGMGAASDARAGDAAAGPRKAAAEKASSAKARAEAGGALDAAAARGRKAAAPADQAEDPVAASFAASSAAALQRGESPAPEAKPASAKAGDALQDGGASAAVRRDARAAKSAAAEAPAAEDLRSFVAAAKARPEAVASRPGGEEKAESKKTESAKTKGDKRRDEARFEVVDYRPQAARAPEAVEKPAPSGESAGAADLTIGLRSGEGGRDAESPSASGAPSTSFSDALARELREGANADIVKQASIVLRGADEGQIRLALKPEALGAVKVKLELADNKIAGHIVVESDEALKAFEQEIRSLEQAFLDGGFDGASIDVSVSADGGRDGRGRGDEGPSPFYSGRLASSTYEGAAVAAAPYPDAGDSAVNVLA